MARFPEGDRTGAAFILTRCHAKRNCRPNLSAAANTEPSPAPGRRFFMVLPKGFEPLTSRLPSGCSTPELRQPTRGTPQLTQQTQKPLYWLTFFPVCWVTSVSFTQRGTPHFKFCSLFNALTVALFPYQDLALRTPTLGFLRVSANYCWAEIRVGHPQRGTFGHGLAVFEMVTLEMFLILTG